MAGEKGQVLSLRGGTVMYLLRVLQEEILICHQAEMPEPEEEYHQDLKQLQQVREETVPQISILKISILSRHLVLLKENIARMQLKVKISVPIHQHREVQPVCDLNITL